MRAVFLLASFVAAGASAQPATLEALDAQIAEAAAEAERSGVRRDRLGVEVGQLAQQREAADRRMRERVRALYRMRRAGLPSIAGGFDALLRHRSRVERLERMVGRDFASLRSLRRRVDALSEQSAQLAAQADEAGRRVSVLRERRAALERATIGAWAGIAPATQPTEEAPWSGGTGLRIVDAPAPSFTAMRGRLDLPVGGSARLSDGEREGGAGLELAAAPGVSVRAVAAGRIAYAASHPAYGRLVILDHGEGYYTVYGGLAVLAVGAGQSVETDARLGALGAQPLFFQVRRGTRPLPAREWIGL